MSHPTVRAYRPSDSDGIIRLVADYRAEQPGRVADREALAATLGAFASSEQDRILVAESDGVIAGYVAVHFLPFPLIEGTEAYISDLLVGGAFRGRGMGGLLLRAVEDEARDRGCVRISLQNRKTASSYVRGFYSQHSFRERDDFASFVKPASSP